MNPEPVSGKILIASNRGPVSFTRGDDGNLTRHRGAGGLVSGLSTVAGQAEVLWVCAALSDADMNHIALYFALQKPARAQTPVPQIFDIKQTPASGLF